MSKLTLKQVNNGNTNPTDGYNFYMFSQNNTHGVFQYDENVCEYVVIEGKDLDDVNERAESLGLYFDGQGDCECCGNRWSYAYHYDKVEPENLIPSSYDDCGCFIDENSFPAEPVRIIHYANGGRKQIYLVNDVVTTIEAKGEIPSVKKMYLYQQVSAGYRNSFNDDTYPQYVLVEGKNAKQADELLPVVNGHDDGVFHLKTIYDNYDQEGVNSLKNGNIAIDEKYINNRPFLHLVYANGSNEYVTAYRDEKY